MTRVFLARKLYILAAGALMIGASTGCVATRKFTRNTVKQSTDPINTKVATLDATTTQQGQKIDNLDRSVARLDETTKAIDDKATAAGRDARSAQQAAAAADAKGAAAQGTADQAQTMARTADGKVTEASKRISVLETNYSYKVVAPATIVHFGFNKDGLDDDAKAALAGLSGAVGGLKRYAVEVQGYADNTGDQASNLALSERRAQAVVRYLTTELKVPLYRISVLGVGQIVPEKGVRQTREMRADNRRVEVKLYSAD